MDEAAKREVGLRISEARNLKSLTQDDLSDLLNVTIRTIQNWEAGDVPLRRLDEIAEAVGKPKAWLIHGAVAPDDDPYVQRMNELHGALEDAHLDELRDVVAGIYEIVRDISVRLDRAGVPAATGAAKADVTAGRIRNKARAKRGEQRAEQVDESVTIPSEAAS